MKGNSQRHPTRRRVENIFHSQPLVFPPPIDPPSIFLYLGTLKHYDSFVYS